jgi:hypothetical protein
MVECVGAAVDYEAVSEVVYPVSEALRTETLRKDDVVRVAARRNVLPPCLTCGSFFGGEAAGVAVHQSL